MSLFIAFLLIYHFDMHWGLYILATGIWAAHTAVLYGITKKQVGCRYGSN
jgi:hypothetical protein